MKESENIRNGWKEMKLEGTWMEGNGIGKKAENSKAVGRNWNWKEPRNLKNRWEEMELEGICKNEKYSISQKREMTTIALILTWK